jgi:hypothetical protein
VSDDPLIREWKTNDDPDARSTHAAVEAALARDRSTRGRERTARVVALGCAAILWPTLLWCAAHGVTPAVRGGYALMAAGVPVMLFAELAYSSWARKARPSTFDSITQVETCIVLLGHQARLMRSAAGWCAPIFLGAGLIGWWIYAERSHAGAIALWAVVAAVWVLSALAGSRKGRDLDARRSRLEQVLRDLRT